MQGRLADYLVVLGPNDSGFLQKRRKNNLRANSHAIFPITLIVLESCKRDMSDLSPELEPVLGIDQQPHNFGGMLTRKVLCVSRAMCFQEDEEEKDRKKSRVLQPITDLVLVGKKETPPPGYMHVEGLPLYYSRSQDHEPLIDIVVINTRKGETCLPDFVKVEKPISSGLTDHQFLCFRRSHTGKKAIGFEPELLGCYPTVEHEDFKLDFQAVSLLCFPRGIILALEPSLPRFFTFVLTGADGKEVYGAALLFYEALDVNEQQETRYSAKAMCVLSHFPFYQAFRQLLNQLYQIAVSPGTLPIEYWISYFFRRVPIPGPSQHITCLMGHAKLVFHQPPALGLPLLDQPLSPLFTFLTIDNVITLFEYCLGEGKIVLYSNSYEGLTMVLESLRALLFPLQWQGLFIPILPSNLAYSLRAPIPFLIGLHRTFLHEVRVSDEVLLVDLDRNHLKLPSQKPTPFPNPLRTYLRTQLEAFVKLYQQRDASQEDNTTFLTSMDSLTPEDCARIRLLFLRVLVVFLADYRKHLRLMEVKENAMLELNEMFDCEGLVGGLRPEFRPFANHIIRSQMFSDFVIHRVLPPGSMDDTRRSQLLYFDWCVALFHAYKEKEERGNRAEDVSVSIWPSELKMDKTPSRDESSINHSRSRLSVDEDPSMSTHGDMSNGAKMSYFQQQFKKASKKMKSVRLLNRGESEESEFEPDFGRLDVDNWDNLSTPPEECIILAQPEPEGIETCNYKKFPKLNAGQFDRFDQLIEMQQPAARAKSSTFASNSDNHIATLTSLVLNALCEITRPKHPPSDALVRLLTSEIYDTWFFLRTCVPSKEDPHLILLSLLIECYVMIKITGIPLSEHILVDVCIYCVRNGLYDHFHILYRIACQIMPHPNVQFFLTVSQHLISARRPSNATRTVAEAPRLPQCIETVALCSSCRHELSGTDIIASMIGPSKSQCPMCSGEVKPELVVWYDPKEHERVPFLKPAALKALVHQYWRQVKDNGGNEDGSSNGSRHLLDLVQADESLFWSSFWWFSSRGSSFGLAELPFLFLFDGPGAEEFKKSPPAYSLHCPMWGPWKLIRHGPNINSSYWQETLDTPAMREERALAMADLLPVLEPSWKEAVTPKLLQPLIFEFLGHRVKAGSSSEVPRLYDKSLVVQLGIFMTELRKKELNEDASAAQYLAFVSAFHEAVEQFISDLDSRGASNQLTGQEVDMEYQRLGELRSMLVPRDVYGSKGHPNRAALVLATFVVGPKVDGRRQNELFEHIEYCNQNCSAPQHRCPPPVGRLSIETEKRLSLPPLPPRPPVVDEPKQGVEARPEVELKPPETQRPEEVQRTEMEGEKQPEATPTTEEVAPEPVSPDKPQDVAAEPSPDSSDTPAQND